MSFIPLHHLLRSACSKLHGIMNIPSSTTKNFLWKTQIALSMHLFGPIGEIGIIVRLDCLDLGALCRIRLLFGPLDHHTKAVSKPENISWLYVQYLATLN
jgi:hypothetical protein